MTYINVVCTTCDPKIADICHWLPLLLAGQAPTSHQTGNFWEKGYLQHLSSHAAYRYIFSYRPLEVNILCTMCHDLHTITPKFEQSCKGAMTLAYSLAVSNASTAAKGWAAKSRKVRINSDDDSSRCAKVMGDQSWDVGWIKSGIKMHIQLDTTTKNCLLGSLGSVYVCVSALSWPKEWGRRRRPKNSSASSARRAWTSAWVRMRRRASR